MDSRLEEDVSGGTALFQMYGKCQSAKDARKLFTELPERDLVAWNAMIAVFSQHGNRKTAFELLAEMKQDGLQPDKITFVSLLNACSDSSALADGKKIHILLDEYESTIVNALINMYSKCGSLEDAESIFRVFPERDVVSWNTMLTAYCHYGQSKAAVQLFGQMQREGVEIDNVTIVSILDACANLADLQEGRLIHAAVLKKPIAIDSVMATALVNMYGKSANLEEAQVVFDEVLERDGILWAAIMAAYAQHGRGEVVLQFFAQMQKECLKPDKITMIHLLHVCSHFGLLEEGFHYFNSIAPNSKPVTDHYVCMVDLLGRVGQLREAEDFIQSMPFEADAVIWTAFLGACRVHGDVERGRKAAEVLVELDPHKAAPYVILSHIYIAALAPNI
ncbi:hypothetical protein O6H91_08G021700 [Diphasiastrum complanatum]|uniref:Uncharacterized protein n=1 Tax=Diphasiastrum complanatum TaxID=34168 RepID=A0ACC2CVJ3_DIPCM|nr:hypothetical protein O6H91_08G021700 [Diphasiastrum complanatum]